ncbi:unnamed protein product [Ascophyllum nodosum]
MVKARATVHLPRMRRASRKRRYPSRSRSRLWYQGYSALSVLKEEKARDMKQLGLVQAAKAVSEKPLPTKAAVDAAEAERWDLLGQASRLRHDCSLLHIGAKAVAEGTKDYAASTILRWVRQFRTTGGFKRDSRGVHERDWTMSEEYLQHELVRWMKTKKRITVKEVRTYINSTLFENETGDLSRLLSTYQVTLPVSLSTTHSWMINLGCKYERATKSFYTDGHERPEVVAYRGEYIEMRWKLALRQPLWAQVRNNGVSTEELAAAGVADEKNIDKVLQALPDFKTERTALQHVVESPGHILLLSPKRHPEVAGVGIGYSWGFSKQKFRRVHNDEVPKNLPANIEATMCTKNYLTIGRVRRFARRTREYCRAYSNLLLDGVIVKSKELIEKMRAKQKAHRNILDMEPGFLNKQ